MKNLKRRTAIENRIVRRILSPRLDIGISKGERQSEIKASWVSACLGFRFLESQKENGNCVADIYWLGNDTENLKRRTAILIVVMVPPPHKRGISKGERQFSIFIASLKKSLALNLKRRTAIFVATYGFTSSGSTPESQKENGNLNAF